MSVYGRVHSHGLADAKLNAEDQEEEWDTDPNYVNDISEKETRKGSKIIQPERETVVGQNLVDLANKAKQQHNEVTLTEYQQKKTLYGGQKDDD